MMQPSSYGRAALRWLEMLVLVFMLAIADTPHCRAQSETHAAEYRVKAAFLYKFGSYVDWPERSFERPDSPIVIGVVGADAMADELAQLIAGRTVNGRSLTVRKLRRGESISDLHILFIGGTDEARVVEAIAAAKGRSLLTVTETENALALGSTINFVLVDDKVRFDIALPSAERGNLKISARLLGVARKVAGAS